MAPLLSPGEPTNLCHNSNATATATKWRSSSLRHLRGGRGRQLDDDIILLHRDRVRLGDIGTLDQVGAALDRDGERARPYRVRIAPGLAGPDGELPSVPRAAQEFLLAREPIVARPIGQDERADLPAA